jgi:hypothetical protein
MLAASLALAIAIAFIPSSRAPAAQGLPAYLRDRGTGVRTSLLGSYVRKGELVVYPFYEYYLDRNLEYKPSELGYGLATDFRGRYRADEGILFFGYGLTHDIVLEFEGAVISAELQKSPSDTATVPARIRESGLGDVEGQIRWRFQRETETRPEFFTYFGTVLPLQKSKKLIGTQHWEHFFGIGLVRGFRWGTLTVRTAAGYDHGTKQFDAGEYAVEWLRRLSPSWRVVAAIEGNQIDEVSFLTEVQWFINRHAVIKINNALGLTPNATDFAPEVGILFSF